MRDLTSTTLNTPRLTFISSTRDRVVRNPTGLNELCSIVLQTGCAEERYFNSGAGDAGSNPAPSIHRKFRLGA